MNILRLAFELFVIYIVYKLIVGFIIPIYRTTKAMKSNMNDIQEKMRQQQQQTNYNQTPPPSSSSTKNKTYSEDYIDYEELK